MAQIVILTWLFPVVHAIYTSRLIYQVPILKLKVMCLCSTRVKTDGRNISQLILNSGNILGLTATGRATIALLQMNRETQVIARKQWMILDIFP